MSYPAILLDVNNNPIPQFWDEAASAWVPVGNTTSSSALYDGTVNASTTAAALSTQACSEVLVQNDPSNTVNISVGNATSQNTVLQPGQSVSLTVNNVNLIYVKAASGTPKVNYLARS